MESLRYFQSLCRYFLYLYHHHLRTSYDAVVAGCEKENKAKPSITNRLEEKIAQHYKIPSIFRDWIGLERILTMRLISTRLALLVSFVALTRGSADDRPDLTKHGKRMIDWVHKEGGFVHPALRLAAPNGYAAMFTDADIAEDDTLFVIPRSCTISAADDSTSLASSMCATTHKLWDELQLGEESEYAPYIQYLLETQSPGQLVDYWSPQGKKMLTDMLSEKGVQVLPPSMEKGEGMGFFSDTCEDGDPEKEFAWMMLTQRSWDDLLIPVFDMSNHRNGNWINTKLVGDSVHDPEQDVTIKASRDIQAGQELHTSYNFCEDCQNRVDQFYGTPEIFRDYGFVEPYPQRWKFHEKPNIAFDLDTKEDDPSKLEVSWGPNPPTNRDIAFLEDQRDRLEAFAVNLETRPEDIPAFEWYHLNTFYQGVTTAISHAISYALEVNCNTEGGSCPVSSRYDQFLPQPDTLDYYDHSTCFDTPNFDEYDNEVPILSDHGHIMFYEDPEYYDTCYDIDSKAMMCGSYRSHYHEMMVHYAARYVEKVKRVLYVGGGDSMLLHEILKYPSLELVVGLEIDQQVTRHSFRKFGTQPHWENDEVQWWYGNVTETLKMLPKEYFGSFDIVFVDMPDTLFPNLSLLLNDEGILVQPGLLLEEFSQLFEYTVQVHHDDVPVICSQALVFGSNGKDFLKVEPNDYDVETILSLLEEPSRFEAWHDYRKNNTYSQAYCEGAQFQDKVEPTDQMSSPGIIMILEAENAISAISSTAVESRISKALEKKGLSVIDTVVYKDRLDKSSMVVVILAEGYVVARRMPEEKYCAFDIHLWSSFEKQEEVKQALLSAVGSPGGKSTSSYRIVAGGMFGVETWKEDQMNRGPRRTSQCDSHGETSKSSAAASSTIDIVLKESMALVGDVNDMMVLVVCGKETESCESLDTLAQISTVWKVVPIYTCGSVEGVNEYMEDGLSPMKECQASVLAQLEGAVADGKKFRVLLLDRKASFAMGQIVHRIFDSKGNTAELFDVNVAVLASIEDESEAWRRQFVERFRHDIIVWEPVFRAEVLFNSSDSSMEMSMLYTGDEDFFEQLFDTLERIENSTGLVSDVRNVQGGLFIIEENREKATQYVLPGAYEQSRPLKQYMSQMPLGLQLIAQLEMVENGDDVILVGDRVKVWYEDPGVWYEGTLAAAMCRRFEVLFDDGDIDRMIDRDQLVKLSSAETTNRPMTKTLTSANVKFAVKEALVSMEEDQELVRTKVHEFKGLGEGSVLVALWSGGSVVVLWDGRKHVDVNIFTYPEADTMSDQFLSKFNKHLLLLLPVLCDEQPRGTGRVVNHLHDLDLDESLEREIPTWAY